MDCSFDRSTKVVPVIKWGPRPLRSAYDHASTSLQKTPQILVLSAIRRLSHPAREVPDDRIRRKHISAIMPFLPTMLNDGYDPELSERAIMLLSPDRFKIRFLVKSNYWNIL